MESSLQGPDSDPKLCKWYIHAVGWTAFTIEANLAKRVKTYTPESIMADTILLRRMS